MCRETLAIHRITQTEAASAIKRSPARQAQSRAYPALPDQVSVVSSNFIAFFFEWKCQNYSEIKLNFK